MQEDGGEISEKHSREGTDGESENSCVTTELSSKERGIDHFDNEEISPVKTNAVSKFLLQIFLKCFMINMKIKMIKY